MVITTMNHSLVGGVEPFFSPYIGNNHPNWLTFFREVENTSHTHTYIYIYTIDALMDTSNENCHAFPCQSHAWACFQGSKPCPVQLEVSFQFNLLITLFFPFCDGSDASLVSSMPVVCVTACEWERLPLCVNNWLTFFRGVQITNQIYIYIYIYV